MSDHGYLTLITCYHFRRTDTDAYDRLLRSLRASLREIGSKGRVILVANGTTDCAESPRNVINDLPIESQEAIVPVTLETNARNVGGLNAGVAQALQFLPDRGDEWIGQVQPGVVLQPGWRQALFSGVALQDALFGRLVYEDDASSIWADGHILKCGRTYNVNFNKPTSGAFMPIVGKFPCLSAAVFRRKALEVVAQRYGNIVFERLPHYGDCTDTALRLTESGHGTFEIRQAATALKRRPKRDLAQEATSQLVAARLYYEDRRHQAEEHLRDKYPRELAEAQRQLDAIVSAPYANTGVRPPRGSTLDRCWT